MFIVAVERWTSFLTTQGSSNSQLEKGGMHPPDWTGCCRKWRSFGYLELLFIGEGGGEQEIERPIGTGLL